MPGFDRIPQSTLPIIAVIIAQVVLIILKITHAINWRWLFVFTPLVVGAGSVLGIFIIGMIVLGSRKSIEMIRD